MKIIWRIKLRIIFSFGHKKTSVSAEVVIYNEYKTI